MCRIIFLRVPCNGGQEHCRHCRSMQYRYQYIDINAAATCLQEGMVAEFSRRVRQCLAPNDRQCMIWCRRSCSYERRQRASERLRMFSIVIVLGCSFRMYSMTHPVEIIIIIIIIVTIQIVCARLPPIDFGRTESTESNRTECHSARRRAFTLLSTRMHIACTTFLRRQLRLD